MAGIGHTFMSVSEWLLHDKKHILGAYNSAPQEPFDLRFSSAINIITSKRWSNVASFFGGGSCKATWHRSVGSASNFAACAAAHADSSAYIMKRSQMVKWWRNTGWPYI